MGKDLRGKELGVGISQRKDGLYTARFTRKNGRRTQKYFKKLQECRNWLADAQFEDDHGSILNGAEMSVDAWYQYWSKNIMMNKNRESTMCNYESMYNSHIKDTLGKLLISDVKPMHCQNVLNIMTADGKKVSTIEKVRSMMHTFFQSALENDVIAKNPVNSNVKAINGKPVSEREALTLEEQKLFLQEALRSPRYYNAYALILQTGLRYGELIALQWDDIDFENKVLHIRRAGSFKNAENEYKEGIPKTNSGIRDIPLTDEAIKILQDQKEAHKHLRIVDFDKRKYVFLNDRRCHPRITTFHMNLQKICRDAGIRNISMHILRHTFATRCAEADMMPVTLQKIMGHSDINVTMNIYVHVTEQRKKDEMNSIQNMLKVV